MRKSYLALSLLSVALTICLGCLLLESLSWTRGRIISCAFLPDVINDMGHEVLLEEVEVFSIFL
jgi:hypothetical protein